MTPEEKVSLDKIVNIYPATLSQNSLDDGEFYVYDANGIKVNTQNIIILILKLLLLAVVQLVVLLL